MYYLYLSVYVLGVLVCFTLTFSSSDIEAVSRRLTISREDLQSFFDSSNASSTADFNGTTIDLIESAIRIEQETFRTLLSAIFDANGTLFYFYFILFSLCAKCSEMRL